ncbi:MAG: NUDIX domain-containing protein [Duodenibacillus sp.]|nr:NUDIX domain-containing protein [Duodenibacillus sp.]
MLRQQAGRLGRLIDEQRRRAGAGEPALPAGALPLMIGGRRAGLVLAGNAAVLAREARGLPLEVTPGRVSLDEAGVRSGVLHALSARLAAAGALPFRHPELLDVVVPGTREAIAEAPRELFRFLGLATASVHGVGRRGGLWFMSRRSLSKPVAPGLWDTLSGGLVAAGETPLSALARETAEEAGLAPGAYRVAPGALARPAFRTRRRLARGWLDETCWCAALEVAEGAEPRPADGEAEAIELVSEETALARIEAGAVMQEAALCLLTAIARTRP